MSRIDRITLDHKWNSLHEDTLLTGTQALVRLPLLRRQLDEALGLDTGGYITGYRGSPLGNYDRELSRHTARLAEAHVVFEPGLNEELAATACWGTQQLNLMAGAKHQGVFAIWYGKGPGLDRSGDVIRHANNYGTAPLGGVLALSGDDPAAKSSTVTNSSEYAWLDLEVPFLDPADVAEVLEYGVKGIALSRASGLWVGMKCVAETMDATMTLRVDPEHFATTAPVTGDFHIRQGDTAQAAEARLRGLRLPAALAFARANGLNRIMADAPNPRFGIVARGKAWNTLRQALQDAGLTPAMLRDAGVRLLKLGMPWPFDADLAREFAAGMEEVLVIEDRRAFTETMLREALYGLPNAPRITGKRGGDGAPLLSENGELDAAAVLRALAARLPIQTEDMARRVAELDALAAAATVPVHMRAPHFCPGCPHNTSTRLPAGSQGMAGIGCHFLVTNMNRETPFYTQMGGEGMPWLGQRHFTSTPHMFANLGDGTYAHSGSLAVRAAIAARANVTYKILVNSAVAMTGGQQPDADVGVPRLAAQMVAEGATRVVVVGDDPERHQGDPLIPAGVTFHARADLDAVQKELREIPGVTVLLYDQECATERRRHRKRGTAPAAARRAVINPRVCEDCGDCSRASNCIAVEPVETPWGRKRHIDQSACNQDMSCVEGFCPSFLTLEGAEPSKPGLPAALLPPPEPARPPQTEPWNLLLAGVGGQGITALAAILAMAAHLEGRPVRGVDMLGLAQKGGGVYGQLRIGLADAAPETLTGPRIGQGQADLMLAADIVVAHGRFARPMLGTDRSVVIASDAVSPTQQFVLNPETRLDAPAMREALRSAAKELVTLPAAKVVEDEFGDLIFLNAYLLGVAYQRGLVPLGAAAILRAFELNGAEVARNQAAFTAGRRDALAPVEAPAPETLEAMIDRLADDLTGWQNRRTSRHYREVVARVAAAERPLGSTRLTEAVARQLYRLTAYKDEYEVARLHADPAWQAELAAHFQGTKAIHMHLAPPALGERKRDFGPWMLRAMGWLRHGKFLRGTALDPFGRTGERREERALAAWFEAGLEELLPKLLTHHTAICEWAEAAAGIKGYGPIKARNLAAARRRMDSMRASLSAPAPAE
ncbi:indolepyruvate ferredoxin oxidoreductase family protein [Rhodovarius crocodyli]|nr:indolepyruvate ferredoxin oxidoreductase family protein [Rhodovarius crocodyli]